MYTLGGYKYSLSRRQEYADGPLMRLPASTLHDFVVSGLKKFALLNELLNRTEVTELIGY